MELREKLTRRLEVRQSALEHTYKAYEKLLSGGVKSYGLGSKNLTRLDLPQLEQTILALEREIDQLERDIAGKSRRKTVAVVFRDR